MGEVVRKNKSSETITLLLVGLIVSTFTVFAVSSSLASTVFILLCMMLGVLLCYWVCDRRYIPQGITIFLLTLVVYVIVVVLKYFDIISEINLFSNLDNDHYMFWVESQVGASSSSISQIYKRCILNNEYFENGGYFLYIQAIAFYAEKLFDGNHLFLQLLGTALPGMLSSILVFNLLGNYVAVDRAKKHSYLYVFLTPALFVCLGIHRDAWIAFFYLCLVYLWLSKGSLIKTIILELVISGLLLTLRIQNGLFAFIFIFLTLFSRAKNYRWAFYVFIGIFFIAYGSVIYSILNDEMTSTVAYYEKLGEESLSSINSGIGRYVYQLPSPIKEVTQVLVLQAQFPPWLSIEQANSFWGVCVGSLLLLINFFWFFVFIYTCMMLMRRTAVKQIPSELLLSVCIFFVFALLNSTNLVLRRVVCIYPCLYIVFMFLREKVISIPKSRHAFRLYAVFYGGLCLLYFIMRAVLG